MTTLLIATRNAHKVGEIQKILGEKFLCLTLKEFPDAPAVIEDAETFAGNATKKAVELARWICENSKLRTKNLKLDFVLADDSGLEVDALNGAPGVHSARFAALDKNENSPDADNNAKLLRLLKDVPAEKRTARFRCVLALVPVALVYSFSLNAINRSIDSWFDVDVKQGLDDALSLSRAALSLRTRELLARTTTVAGELRGLPDPQLLAELERYRRLSGASEFMVVGDGGRILGLRLPISICQRK